MIVEDDPVLARELELLLKKWDFQVKADIDFKHVDRQCLKYAPDLILLDINLPYYDGFYWCQKIRNTSTVPILFISSREQNADKIMALSAGGDDYIEKPFDLEVLLVKIKAMLRRTYEYKQLEKEYLDDDTCYDLLSGRLIHNDQVLELTKSESKIMTTLLEHRGNCVSREQLMMVLWNTDEFVTDATLSVHISRLRNKLKELIYQGISEALANVNLTYNAVADYKKPKVNIEQPAFEFNYDVEDEIDPILKSTDNENINHVDDKNNETFDNIENEVVDKENNYNLVQEQNIEYIVPDKQVVETKVESREKLMKKKLLVKGQVHGTYIICEDETGMYLVDQHAAQERINYEYFLDKYQHLNLSMRDLLVPITLEYPLSEFLIIEERKQLLSQVGINLEVFGNCGYVIKQLPLWMQNIDEQVFIEDMVDQVLKDNKVDVVKLQDHAIATLSCKASLKGNTHLSNEGMQNIIDNLMRCDNPYVCPHGRPTLVYYSSYEIEKLFKRVA